MSSSMQLIESLGELTLEELQRMRRTLAKRFGIAPAGAIREVGFGVAEKDDRTDPNRLDAICFWVADKSDRVSDGDRIPAVVAVRLRRGKRYVLVRLPSDVLQQPLPPRPSGRPLAVRGVPQRQAAAGGILAWKIVGQSSSLTWAVLTVGHLFVQPRLTRPPASGVAAEDETAEEMVDGAIDEAIEGATVVEMESAGGGRVVGQLAACTRRRDGSQVDAAIVIVARRDLVASGLMPDNVSTRGKRVRTVQQLWRDQRRAGHSLVQPQPIEIEIGRYYPQSSLVAQLGTLIHVFEARSSVPQAFAPGRSGTLWALDGQAAGMQHAGYPLRFTRGLAQSLSVALQWAVAAIAKRHETADDQVDLRLIRAL